MKNKARIELPPQMTDKELKRLRRVDLLELLITLGRENEQIRKRRQLADRTITVEKAGRGGSIFGGKIIRGV